MGGLALGADHIIMLKQYGSVWTAGWNAEGQLGDDSTTNRLTFVRVVSSGATGATGAAVEYAHSMPLKDDGSVLTFLWEEKCSTSYR